MTTANNKETNDPDLLECDLVMKGGITSGIVYPALVLTLSRKYRFRSIGGTSAGAIAAAVTAAAECGREAKGFEKLDQVREQLGQVGFLRNLFQPSPTIAPLMNTAFALAQKGKRKNGNRSPGRWFLNLTVALCSNDPLFFAIGAAAGVALSIILAWLIRGKPAGWALILVALGWSGGLAGAVTHLLWILIRRVPGNFFGFCTGLKEPTVPEGSEALTDWLDAALQELAGRDKTASPLTFGDLESRGITLRMVTTDLSQNQPYELPFEDDVFIFNEEELCRLFPERIVEHMTRHAAKIEEYSLPPKYHFLPRADQLPVIFATRLSLSFPVLISAVPLYTISKSALEGGSGGGPTLLPQIALQKNWFSDGGISSNFPIHLFDAWLPTRPTFGVELTSLPAEGLTPDKMKIYATHLSYCPGRPFGKTKSGSPQPDGTLDAVYLPRADEELPPEWIPLPHLFAFLWSIFSTAQNYRDNTLSLLPSYRERIVQIRLSDDEGGLNLAMPESTVHRVVEKGRAAGDLLSSKFNFPHHQWVRFRVLMEQLERNLKEMEEENAISNSGRLLSSQSSQDFPYPLDPQWVEDARKRLDRIGELIQSWGQKAVFNDPEIVPKPVLRVTPKF